MTHYRLDGNGTPIEGLQPVPGGTITHTFEDTAWLTFAVPADTVLVEISATAPCRYFIERATAVPTEEEALLDETLIRRDGIAASQVVHIKAVAATVDAPVIITITPQRPPVA